MAIVRIIRPCTRSSSIPSGRLPAAGDSTRLEEFAWPLADETLGLARRFPDLRACDGDTATRGQLLASAGSGSALTEAAFAGEWLPDFMRMQHRRNTPVTGRVDSTVAPGGNRQMQAARTTRNRQPAPQRRLLIASQQMRAGSRPSQQMRAGGLCTAQAR